MGNNPALLHKMDSAAVEANAEAKAIHEAGVEETVTLAVDAAVKVLACR